MAGSVRTIKLCYKSCTASIQYRKEVCIIYSATLFLLLQKQSSHKNKDKRLYPSVLLVNCIFKYTVHKWDTKEKKGMEWPLAPATSDICKELWEMRGIESYTVCARAKSIEKKSECHLHSKLKWKWGHGDMFVLWKSATINQRRMCVSTIQPWPQYITVLYYSSRFVPFRLVVTITFNTCRRAMFEVLIRNVSNYRWANV